MKVPDHYYNAHALLTCHLDAIGFVLAFNTFNPDHFENVFLIDTSNGLENINIGIEADPDFPGTGLVLGAGWETFTPCDPNDPLGDPCGPLNLGKGNSK